MRRLPNWGTVPALVKQQAENLRDANKPSQQPRPAWMDDPSLLPKHPPRRMEP